MKIKLQDAKLTDYIDINVEEQPDTNAEAISELSDSLQQLTNRVIAVEDTTSSNSNKITAVENTASSNSNNITKLENKVNNYKKINFIGTFADNTTFSFNVLAEY